MQKQPPRSVLMERSSGNVHQIYRRTTVPKCSSIRLLCSPVSLLYIFRTHFQGTPMATTASDYFKTGIWSKSVINKLQFDERNKSLEC